MCICIIISLVIEKIGILRLNCLISWRELSGMSEFFSGLLFQRRQTLMKVFRLEPYTYYCNCHFITHLKSILMMCMYNENV